MQDLRTWVNESSGELPYFSNIHCSVVMQSPLYKLIAFLFLFVIGFLNRGALFILTSPRLNFSGIFISEDIVDFVILIWSRLRYIKLDCKILFVNGFFLYFPERYIISIYRIIYIFGAILAAKIYKRLLVFLMWMYDANLSHTGISIYRNIGVTKGKYTSWYNRVFGKMVVIEWVLF